MCLPHDYANRPVAFNIEGRGSIITRKFPCTRVPHFSVHHTLDCAKPSFDYYPWNHQLQSWIERTNCVTFENETDNYTNVFLLFLSTSSVFSLPWDRDFLIIIYRAFGYFLRFLSYYFLTYDLIIFHFYYRNYQQYYYSFSYVFFSP